MKKGIKLLLFAVVSLLVFMLIYLQITKSNTSNSIIEKAMNIDSYPSYRIEGREVTQSITGNYSNSSTITMLEINYAGNRLHYIYDMTSFQNGKILNFPFEFYSIRGENYQREFIRDTQTQEMSGKWQKDNYNSFKTGNQLGLLLESLNKYQDEILFEETEDYLILKYNANSFGEFKKYLDFNGNITLWVSKENALIEKYYYERVYSLVPYMQNQSKTFLSQGYYNIVDVGEEIIIEFPKEVPQ